MATATKKRVQKKFNQPLTVKDFLEGLDKFYDGKIEPRFTKIERKLAEHDKKFNDMYNHIDGLYKKFEDLKIEYHLIVSALERIEKYIKQDVEDKKAFREELSKLKSDVQSLTTRIEILEKQVAV